MRTIFLRQFENAKNNDRTIFLGFPKCILTVLPQQIEDSYTAVTKGVYAYGEGSAPPHARDQGNIHFDRISIRMSEILHKFLIFTRVRGMVRRHRQKSETARLQTNTFLAVRSSTLNWNFK